MDLLITGVGDAFTAIHYGSSAVVRAPDGLILIDCPDPIHRVLRDAVCSRHAANDHRWDSLLGLGAPGVSDILLTHLHGDHCNGLEGLGFARWAARQQGVNLPRPRLWTHPQAAARLWQRLAPAMDRGSRTIDDFYDLRVLDAGTTQVAGLGVRWRLGTHPLPCAGFILSAPREGRQVAWSGDTGFSRDHVDWLDDGGRTAVICHECNHAPAHAELHDLEALPAALRGRMVLYHLPDAFPAQRSSLRLLQEGDVL